MHFKSYIRMEPDGVHWPDANVGDDLYYGINFTDYLKDTDDETITTVVWTLPVDVVTSDDFIENDICIVKLSTLKVGTYKITCSVTTVTNLKEQTQVVPMILTVY